jgi:hypothetical protein
MKVIHESRLVGEFFGYWVGIRYRLEDGSEWQQQQDLTEDGVYRENPLVRVYWDASLGRHLMDVEGSSTTVWVKRYHRRGSGHSAY